jgi:hypothetical protein
MTQTCLQENRSAYLAVDDVEVLVREVLEHFVHILLLVQQAQGLEKVTPVHQGNGLKTCHKQLLIFTACFGIHISATGIHHDVPVVSGRSSYALTPELSPIHGSCSPSHYNGTRNGLCGTQGT